MAKSGETASALTSRQKEKDKKRERDLAFLSRLTPEQRALVRGRSQGARRAASADDWRKSKCDAKSGSSSVPVSPRGGETAISSGAGPPRGLSIPRVKGARKTSSPGLGMAKAPKSSRKMSAGGSSGFRSGYDTLLDNAFGAMCMTQIDVERRGSARPRDAPSVRAIDPVKLNEMGRLLLQRANLTRLCLLMDEFTLVDEKRFGISLFNYFEWHEVTEDCIIACTIMQIQQDEVNVVLRSQSLATVMCSIYLSKKAHAYRKELLKDFSDKIITYGEKHGFHFQHEQSEHAPDQPILDAMVLVQIAIGLLDTLVSTVDNCPPKVRKLLVELYVGLDDPALGMRVVVNLFILRFICPAATVPFDPSFDIVPQRPASPETRKAFSLVGKFLLCMANSVTWVVRRDIEKPLADAVNRMLDSGSNPIVTFFTKLVDMQEDLTGEISQECSTLKDDHYETPSVEPSVKPDSHVSLRTLARSLHIGYKANPKMVRAFPSLFHLVGIKAAHRYLRSSSLPIQQPMAEDVAASPSALSRPASAVNPPMSYLLSSRERFSLNPNDTRTIRASITGEDAIRLRQSIETLRREEQEGMLQTSDDDESTTDSNEQNCTPCSSHAELHSFSSPSAESPARSDSFSCDELKTPEDLDNDDLFERRGSVSCDESITFDDVECNIPMVTVDY